MANNLKNESTPENKTDRLEIINENALRESLSSVLHLETPLEPITDFKEKLKHVIAISPNRITFDAGANKGYVTVSIPSSDMKLILANLHVFENLRSISLEKDTYSLFMESWPKSLESIGLCGSIDITPLACGKFTNLKKLSFLKTDNPVNLNVLEPIAHQIRSLCFKACMDEEILSSFNNLEILACGELNSVAPLHNLPNLTHLFIENYKGQDINGLDTPNLNAIRIQSSTLQNIDGIRNCSKLEIALFVSCQEGIRSIEPLSELKNLRELTLGSPAVKDFSPLSRMTAIENLALYDTFIENTEVLRNLHRLTELHLQGAPYSNRSFYKPLADLKNLRKLWIPYRDEDQLPTDLQLDQLNDRPFREIF